MNKHYYRDMIIEHEYQKAIFYKGQSIESKANLNQQASISERSIDPKKNDFNEDELMELMFSSDVCLLPIIILHCSKLQKEIY